MIRSILYGALIAAFLVCFLGAVAAKPAHAQSFNQCRFISSCPTVGSDDLGTFDPMDEVTTYLSWAGSFPLTRCEIELELHYRMEEIIPIGSALVLAQPFAAYACVPFISSGIPACLDCNGGLRCTVTDQILGDFGYITISQSGAEISVDWILQNQGPGDQTATIYPGDAILGIDLGGICIATAPVLMPTELDAIVVPEPTMGAGLVAGAMLLGAMKGRR